MSNFYKTILILFAVLWVSVGVSPAQAKGNDFTLPDVNGVKHKLSDYRGKWVVVNYWATWCQPCLQEIPELVMFHDKHKDKDAVVLGVVMEDIAAQDLREFMDDHLMDYPVLRGSSKYDSPLGPVPGLPVTYLIAPNGEVATSHLGRVDAQLLEAFIKSPSTQFQPDSLAAGKSKQK